MTPPLGRPDPEGRAGQRSAGVRAVPSPSCEGESLPPPREELNALPPAGWEGRGPQTLGEKFYFGGERAEVGQQPGRTQSGRRRGPRARGGEAAPPLTAPAALAPPPVGKADGGAAPSPPSRGSRPPPTLGPGKCGAHPAGEGARVAGHDSGSGTGRPREPPRRQRGERARPAPPPLPHPPAARPAPRTRRASGGGRGGDRGGAGVGRENRGPIPGRRESWGGASQARGRGPRRGTRACPGWEQGSGRRGGGDPEGRASPTPAGGGGGRAGIRGRGAGHRARGIRGEGGGARNGVPVRGGREPLREGVGDSSEKRKRGAEAARTDSPGAGKG